jgi:glycosyltransferase involved in cell wall biosynthesis
VSGLNKKVRISVITATWNCAEVIADCLGSVASQDYADLEHIVIDGASTDGTLAVLEQHRSQLSAMISEPDRGIYDALNKGIALASGDVIGFLHADDMFGNEVILSEVAEAFSDPSVAAVYGDLEYVSRSDSERVVRHWRAGNFSARRLAWGWMPPHPTLYVRREWYERIGGLNPHFRISADYLSILQLFSHPHFHAVYLPKVMVRMRLGGESNRSLRNIVRKSREDLVALQLTRVGGVGALVWKNLSKLVQFTRR